MYFFLNQINRLLSEENKVKGGAHINKVKQYEVLFFKVSRFIQFV